jgi:hypothetical protein
VVTVSKVGKSFARASRKLIFHRSPFDGGRLNVVPSLRIVSRSTAFL